MSLELLRALLRVNPNLTVGDLARVSSALRGRA